MLKKQLSNISEAVEVLKTIFVTGILISKASKIVGQV
jgi:hypothetical protein